MATTEKATTTRKTTTRKAATKKVEVKDAVTEEIEKIEELKGVEAPVEEVAEEPTAPMVAKATTSRRNRRQKLDIAPTEGIYCRSVTPGKLIFVGKKSKNIYKWFSADECVEVEFQDLEAARYTRSEYIYSPLFVIEDEEILENWKDVADLYEGIFAEGDLQEIFALTTQQLARVLPTLPDSIKKTIASSAVTMKMNGELDALSLGQVQVIDKVLGTELLND